MPAPAPTGASGRLLAAMLLLPWGCSSGLPASIWGSSSVVGQVCPGATWGSGPDLGSSPRCAEDAPPSPSSALAPGARRRPRRVTGLAALTFLSRGFPRCPGELSDRSAPRRPLRWREATARGRGAHPRPDCWRRLAFYLHLTGNYKGGGLCRCVAGIWGLGHGLHRVQQRHQLVSPQRRDVPAALPPAPASSRRCCSPAVRSQSSAFRCPPALPPTTRMAGLLWGSFLLVWVIKGLVTPPRRHALYRKTVPAFLGFALGHFLTWRRLGLSWNLGKDLYQGYIVVFGWNPRHQARVWERPKPLVKGRDFPQSAISPRSGEKEADPSIRNHKCARHQPAARAFPWESDDRAMPCLAFWR